MLQFLAIRYICVNVIKPLEINSWIGEGYQVSNYKYFQITLFLRDNPRQGEVKYIQLNVKTLAAI